MAGRIRRRIFDRHNVAGLRFAAQPAISSCRLALVFHHARAGDRNRGGRTSGPRRSLHLFAAHWFIYRADLVGRRSLKLVTLSETNFCRTWRRHYHHLKCRLLETNDLLAELRNALDSYPGGNKGQRRRAHEPRFNVDGSRAIGRRAQPFSNCAGYSLEHSPSALRFKFHAHPY